MIFIKKIPLPLSGLMLSWFALGNLIKPHSHMAYEIMSFVGLSLFILITSKIILNYKGVLEDLKHPVVSSVFPTYTMGLMLLSVYLKMSFGINSLYLWYAALMLHSLLILNYTLRFIINFDFKKIFPSIFIIFVGVTTASLTAPAFDKIILGQIAFYFGLIAYVTTLPIVVYRLLKHKPLPLAAQPTFAIMAAPASLLLAGYMTSFKGAHNFLIYLLLGLSIFMYLLVLMKLPKLLSLEFSPAFAAYTFPLVISATALKKTSVILDISLLKQVSTFQLILATILVLYVSLNFLKFFTHKKEKSVDTLKEKIS